MGNERSGNPNPSPRHRFAVGNTEQRRKQKGCRDRISKAFLEAFADDFEEHGVKAIVQLRKDDVASYVRVAVALQPKEIEHRHVLEGVDDAQIEAMIEDLQTSITERANRVQH